MGGKLDPCLQNKPEITSKLAIFGRNVYSEGQNIGEIQIFQIQILPIQIQILFKLDLFNSYLDLCYLNFTRLVFPIQILPTQILELVNLDLYIMHLDIPPFRYQHLDIRSCPLRIRHSFIWIFALLHLDIQILDLRSKFKIRI